MSRWLLKVSEEGDSTSSLGNLFQWGCHSKHAAVKDATTLCPYLLIPEMSPFSPSLETDPHRIRNFRRLAPPLTATINQAWNPEHRKKNNHLPLANGRPTAAHSPQVVPRGIELGQPISVGRKKHSEQTRFQKHKPSEQVIICSGSAAWTLILSFPK